jgi:hypothetical protein
MPGTRRVAARGREAAIERVPSDDATLFFERTLAPGDWVSVLVRRGRKVTAWSNAVYVR